MYTNIKRFGIIGILAACFVFITGCSEDWNEHYRVEAEYSDVKLWDSIKNINRFSEYVTYIERYELDDLIISDNSKILFLPDNEAFNAFLQENDTAGLEEILRYSIVPTLFMVRNIEAAYKVRTYSGKFALIEYYNFNYYIDGEEIVHASPLFSDGKYYEIDKLLAPRPNLYQYIKENYPAAGGYLDSQDTTILDRINSEPLGFDSLGRTIYDSVLILANRFEEQYFEVSTEFREVFATMVLPTQQEYDAALDRMAENLTAQFASHKDIPDEWQYTVFFPSLMKKGTFAGLMNPEDFDYKKIVNINGDSIVLDYKINPESKVVLSNGIIYNYATEFNVPKALYQVNGVEGEHLVDSVGVNLFAWNEEKVSITSPVSFSPIDQRVLGASNDSVANVSFGSRYDNTYTITFYIPHVFPSNYRFVWRTNYRISGTYKIYINDELLKLGSPGYEEFDTYNLSAGFFSSKGIKVWPDSRGFCDVDGNINLTEYGDVKVTFEYTGPGFGSSNGFSIDYVELIQR